MFETTEDIAWAKQLPQTFTSQDIEDIKAEIDVPRANVIILNTVYSPEETKVGVWREYRTVEGQQVLMQKLVYEKTIYCGALPNNSTKSVSLGVSDIDKVVDYKGMLQSSSFCLDFNAFISTNNIANNVASFINKSDNTFEFTTRNDMSEYDAYATIRYAKTTDEWEVVE
jgi:hypothetical protein